MKKFFTILLTISMCMSLMACSNNIKVKPIKNAQLDTKKQSTTKKSTTTQETTTKKPIPTTTQVPTTTQAPTTTLAPTTTEASTTKAIVSTALFETVYFPYANRENPFLFEAVKTFAQAQSSNYIVEIIEQADQNPTITLTDENGNYVFFNFSPANDMNMLTLFLISYYDVSANAEVSFSNYSTDGSRRYDTFDVHTLGGQSKEVKNPNEQRKFLFDK